jgi:hypothetical protein
MACLAARPSLLTSVLSFVLTIFTLLAFPVQAASAERSIPSDLAANAQSSLANHNFGPCSSWPGGPKVFDVEFVAGHLRKIKEERCCQRNVGCTNMGTHGHSRTLLCGPRGACKQHFSSVKPTFLLFRNGSNLILIASV